MTYTVFCIDCCPLSWQADENEHPFLDQPFLQTETSTSLEKNLKSSCEERKMQVLDLS